MGLAVIEPDGYVRIKDRSKDVIISGGENIFSVEVEDILHRHPRWTRLRWWPSPTQNGARCRALSLSFRG
jgi:acyl-CoA synthetase (AMP-forming)/AMP-acid ligase II